MTDAELEAAADATALSLMASLERNVRGLDKAKRAAIADEFLDFAGRLIAVFAKYEMTPARAAATLYVFNNLPDLGVDDEHRAQIILTLVSAMNHLRANSAAAEKPAESKN